MRFMPLRLSADWMTVCDDRLLEFIQEEGQHTPKAIAEDGRVRFGHQYIARRLRKLADVGLLERNVGGRGIYDITEAGEAYLEGDLDAAELEEPG